MVTSSRACPTATLYSTTSMLATCSQVRPGEPSRGAQGAALRCGLGARGGRLRAGPQLLRCRLLLRLRPCVGGSVKSMFFGPRDGGYDRDEAMTSDTTDQHEDEDEAVDHAVTGEILVGGER